MPGVLGFEDWKIVRTYKKGIGYQSICYLRCVAFARKRGRNNANRDPIFRVIIICLVGKF